MRVVGRWPLGGHTMHLKPLRSPNAVILVLEDDAFLRAGLCSVLSTAGYEVAGNEGGSDPARIDLVLAGIGDGRVPEIALAQRDRATPVVLLADRSAWSGLAFLDAANAFNAAAVLQRPFSGATLLRLVAQMLAQTARDGAVAVRPLELVQPDNPNFV
jgi:CheY-like chemotaxis protein